MNRPYSFQSGGTYVNAVHRLRLVVSDSNVLVYTENILNDKSTAWSNLCCSP